MRYFVLSFLLMLTSCATKVHTLKPNKDHSIGSAKGYILLGIETNRDLESILIIGKQRIRLTEEELKKGTNYLLIDLKVGKYQFDQIRLNQYLNLQLNKPKYWSFEIKAQQVNYVGHLELARKGYWEREAFIELVNRSSEALEFMEKKFPAILQKHRMIYGGPGEDGFFELVEKMGVTHD